MSVVTWERWTATNANPTATAACPTIFVVLFSPSDRCRQIFSRSSMAPTTARPMATPRTASPARVKGVRTLATA